MKPIQIQPIQARFLKLRRRILKEAWEEEKKRLIAEGYPASALESPPPQKKPEEPRH